jgi:hypothetical protein
MSNSTERKASIGEILWAFVTSSKYHWKQLTGGSLVAILIGLGLTMGLNIPPIVAGLIAFGLAVLLACFLAFRDQYLKVQQFESQMKSRIKVSCGRSVDKSVVTADGEMWFRARLDLEGCTAVPDIEASVTDLWEDGQRVPLSEYLTLTMYPGILIGGFDTNKKTLNEGRPEFVDIIRVANGMAHFPLKIYPRAVAHATLLKPKHTYRIIVVICSSSNNRTDICTFEFEWTGDPNTSEIRLIGVMPPSLTPDRGAPSGVDHSNKIGGILTA